MSWLARLVGVGCLAAMSPGIAVAASINVGYISWDELIPGISFFNVLNFTGDPMTGGFALPPDFPTTDSLVFLNATLTLTDDSATTVIIALGDLTPGPISPTGSISFPGTALYANAVFQATLSQQMLLQSDGSTFAANSVTVMAQLNPSVGLFLTPGADFALLTLSDDPLVGVPEPSSFLSISSLLLLLIAVRGRQLLRLPR